MAIKLSVAVRNAKLNAIETTAGTSAEETMFMVRESSIL